MTLLWSSTIQSLGLIADIFGAGLLFLFGVPPLNRSGGASFLELESVDTKALEKEKEYDRYGKIGLLLLVSGFFCNWCRMRSQHISSG
jgi:hypothetical protein